MDNTKESLTEFTKENSPLLTAFGVFTALAVYFKTTEVYESIAFAPLFLSLLIIFELYRNLLMEKKSASTTLKLFEVGLFFIIYSIFFYILSEYTMGRLLFGMGLGVSVSTIVYQKIRKYIDNIFTKYIKILAILYLVAFLMWYFILMAYIGALSFEPFFKEIFGGFMAGIFMFLTGILLYSLKVRRNK